MYMYMCIYIYIYIYMFARDSPAPPDLRAPGPPPTRRRLDGYLAQRVPSPPGKTYL